MFLKSQNMIPPSAHCCHTTVLLLLQRKGERLSLADETIGNTDEDTVDNRSGNRFSTDFFAHACQRYRQDKKANPKGQA